ncbi:Pogo transposable element with KRAB domainlike [Phytophthora cinnamomi]|uniref:Pogo transposable element with KRAB domainlike n=1 Tax=Phytophthora cinnamomi TaxID=4785 RepID=UPI00355A654E|nr:Pogo transposable element with KRAB domainlike [Phytophthora cinnamomi]
MADDDGSSVRVAVRISRSYMQLSTTSQGNSYLDWHVAKHDVYGEQFCTSWEAADEDHEDMDDFNLDELHDALNDAALIDE